MPILAFTSEYGTAPPQEITDLLEEIEKLPGAQRIIRHPGRVPGILLRSRSGVGVLVLEPTLPHARGWKSSVPLILSVRTRYMCRVSRLSRIGSIALLLLASGQAILAIEKFAFVDTADVVVVGQIKLSSYFLSFDGLHVNGTIVATEILYGDGHAGTEFAYHLVVPCSLWDAISGVCSYRGAWQHWSEMKAIVNQTEIWALVKGPGSSWTSVDPKLAFIYHLTDREKVIEVLKRRRQREHDHPKP